MMLTAARLREVVRYNPATGQFRWRDGGALAGQTHSEGYLQLRVDGRQCLAHRLAWLFCFGEHPKRNVDHKNTVKTDNRISNLREATHSQNAANSRKIKPSVSGLKGVHWYARTEKWHVQICVQGRRHNLGYFTDKSSAHAAYAAAATKHFGAFARTA